MTKWPASTTQSWMPETWGIWLSVFSTLQKGIRNRAGLGDQLGPGLAVFAVNLQLVAEANM